MAGFWQNNLNEMQISAPKNLLILKEEGIDAFLAVKSAAGYDGLPQSATVRMNSTYDGQVIVGVTWQNAWGGHSGSIADRMMRKDIQQSAAEIAKELVKGIQKRPINQ